MAKAFCFHTHDITICLRRLGIPRGLEHGSLTCQEASQSTTVELHEVHDSMHGKGGLANQEALNREAWQSRKPKTKNTKSCYVMSNLCKRSKYMMGCLQYQETLHTMI